MPFKQIEKSARENLDQASKKETFHANSDTSKCCLIGFEEQKGEFKTQKRQNVKFIDNEYIFKHTKTQKLEEETDKESKKVSSLSQLPIDRLLPKKVDGSLQNPDWFTAMKKVYDSLVEKNICSLVKNNKKSSRN